MLSNTTYFNQAYQGNLVENWLFKFFHTDEAADEFIALGTADADVSSVHYHGVVLGTPTIRSRIDLAKSTASVDNLTITLQDIPWEGAYAAGSLLSEELLFGTRYYLNRKVEIYSQLNFQSTLSNCLQVGLFRLTDVSQEAGKVVCRLASHRPWDFLSIPNEQTARGNYFPVAWGDFTRETSTQASQQFCDDAQCWPMPVDNIDAYINCLLIDEAGLTNETPHYYDKNLDLMIPLDPVSLTQEVYESGYAIRWRNTDDDVIDLRRGFKYNSVVEDSSINQWDNFDNLILTGSNWMSYTHVNSPDGAGPYYHQFTPAPPDGNVTELKVAFDYELEITSKVGSPTMYLYWGKSTSLNSIATKTTVGTSTGSVDTTFTVTDGDLPKLAVMTTVVASGADNVSGQVRINNLQVKVKISLDTTETQSSNKELANLKQMYCGSDGFEATWDSDPITEIHEAHRDILQRYTGFVSGDLDTTSWTAIEAEKDWACRYWITKPEDVKKVLERLQYEGGFIFRWRPDGTGGYVFVSDTYASVDATLTKDDIGEVKSGHTSISDLLTKMTVNYNRHPAENSYRTTVDVENSTARTNWNIQSAENVKEVNLQAYVSPPINDTDTKANDNFWTYYANIFGDVKKVAACDVLNPRYFGLETGDTIEFNNVYPEKCFADDWTDIVMMVTSLQRSPGKLSIELREVGSL